MTSPDLHVLEKTPDDPTHLRQLPDGSWLSSASLMDSRRHRHLQRICLHASHAEKSFIAGTIRDFRRIDRLRGENMSPQVRYEVIFERDATMTAMRMPRRSGERSSTGYGPDPPSQEEERFRDELAMVRSQLEASDAKARALQLRIRSLESNISGHRQLIAMQP